MLPDAPGTYVLILKLSQPSSILCGRLGHVRLAPGWYAYAGSALGAGGLAARIAHHLRPARSPHWHIDYLRAACQPVALWYAAGTERHECAWAAALARLPGSTRPVPRFGASDCRCPGHLAHLTVPPDVKAFISAVAQPLALETLALGNTKPDAL